MSKRVTLITILLLLTFMLQATTVDQVKEAETLFKKGLYQEAINMYTLIIKENPDTLLAYKAEKEIIICSYYDWDLPTAIKRAETILVKTIPVESDFFSVKFDIYYWLIISYKALKDNANEIKTIKRLITFFESNSNLLTDKKQARVIKKMKKKIRY